MKKIDIISDTLLYIVLVVAPIMTVFYIDFWVIIKSDGSKTSSYSVDHMLVTTHCSEDEKVYISYIRR
jgi:hypothetical protein